MRIEHDLLRAILIDIADYEGADELNDYHLSYEGVSDLKKKFHLEILQDENYIKALKRGTKEDTYFMNLKLTLKGQLLLEQIEDESVWRKLKKYFKDNALELSIESIKLYLGSQGL